MHQAQLDSIVSRMESNIDRGWAPGVMLRLEHAGDVVLQSALGMADVEAGLPMRDDTIFRWASMTKPVTAVAVLMLYEVGELQLGDPVSCYLPAFANEQVTIRRLLTHTSGIHRGPPNRLRLTTFRRLRGRRDSNARP